MVYPHNKEVLPGPETTYASLGARWANVANTPFRFNQFPTVIREECTFIVMFESKVVMSFTMSGLEDRETTYASLGARWANVANTPFRFWKAKSYEGGICTPMIAHWPKGIKKNVGKTTPEIGHVMDIMATCIDMAGATYPTKYKGNDIIPLEGKSLVPIFKTGHLIRFGFPKTERCVGYVCPACSQ